MQDTQSQGTSVRRTVIANNPICALWKTVIGKKIVMALTGIVLVGFVIGHVAGNMKIFVGPESINQYSRFLREVGTPEIGYEQLLWVVRAVLLGCVGLHIKAALELSQMSWKARPVAYQEKKNIETSTSATSMRIGGSLLLIFIIFHIAHLTLGKVGFAAGEFHHLEVYQNVIAAFHHMPVAIFYVIAMCALFLHLDHGMWSMLQTLGFNNRKNQSQLRAGSRIIAFLVFAGFVSVPIAVVAGWIH